MQDKPISLPESIRQRLPERAQEIYQAVFTTVWRSEQSSLDGSDLELRAEKAHEVARWVVQDEFGADGTFPEWEPLDNP